MAGDDESRRDDHPEAPPTPDAPSDSPDASADAATQVHRTPAAGDTASGTGDADTTGAATTEVGTTETSTTGPRASESATETATGVPTADAAGEGATAVHPTAVHGTGDSASDATPPGGTPRAEDSSADTTIGTQGTQVHEVPPAPGPWQPGAAAGTPVAPWAPGTGPGASTTGTGTSGFAAPPGPAAGPTFGTPPATGGAGPWGTAPFAGQGQPGYGAPGYGPPPGGPGGPGSPGGPGGPGAPYGYTGPFGPPPGAQPPGTGSSAPRRKGLIIGIAAAVVVLLLATTVLLIATRQASPSTTLEATVGDVRGWEGATYSGRVPDSAGAQANLEMTVDRSGNAVGTVTRDGGGRAEFVLTGREQAIRGDRAWWERAAPRPELADRLTDQWLSDAFTVLPSGLPSWNQPPESLANRLSATDVGEQDEIVVGGEDARVLTPGTDGRSVTVVDGEPPRLVAFDLPGFGTGRLSPVTVKRADPAALALAANLANQAPTMKSYIVAITERPRLTLTVEGGGGTCREPTCTVTVRLVNTGTIATSGTIVVTLNDAEVARHPFTSAPGSNLTFPTSADNPVYSQPGAQITALWRARVEGGR